VVLEERVLRLPLRGEGLARALQRAAVVEVEDDAWSG
jgi:hypothetical protein